MLVQGDTTTAFAAALAAFYNKMPVGHIEAGLRTHKLDNPWPEEANRCLISKLCRWHFAPTIASFRNLQDEGIKDSIYVVGNTVIDSLLITLSKLGEVKEEPFILVTGHRRESFGEGFENICEGLEMVAKAYPHINLLYPVHLNPCVREVVNRRLSHIPNIKLVDPLGYIDFVKVLKACLFVLTDSGGVQEEAPTLGKPVLLMRETTERTEGVIAGTCTLVGTNPKNIFDQCRILLDNPVECLDRYNPYGDGKASERIKDILEKDLA